MDGLLKVEQQWVLTDRKIQCLVTHCYSWIYALLNLYWTSRCAPPDHGHAPPHPKVWDALNKTDDLQWENTILAANVDVLLMPGSVCCVLSCAMTTTKPYILPLSVTSISCGISISVSLSWTKKLLAINCVFKKFIWFVSLVIRKAGFFHFMRDFVLMVKGYQVRATTFCEEWKKTPLKISLFKVKLICRKIKNIKFKQYIF